MPRIFCHGLKPHTFNKWEIVDESEEGMNVTSIQHADHTKKHIIKQKRVCQYCGYTEMDVQVKFA